MKSFSLSQLRTVAGILLALIALAGAASNAHATALPSDGLAISPAKQEQAVVPGQTYTFYYKVFNPNAAKFSVNIVASSDAGWKIAVSPAQTVLEPQTSREFKVQVTVPRITSSSASLVTIQVFSPSATANDPSRSAVAYLGLTVAPRK